LSERADDPYVFVEERFIDRVAERDIFRRMLTFESEERVLTISDASGRGKSQLLLALRHHCQFASQEVPAVLVPLHELAEKTPPGLVRVLEQRLRAAGILFPRLDAVESDAPVAAPPAGPIAGAVDAPAMTVAPGGVAAGNVFQGPVTFAAPSSPRTAGSPLAPNSPEAVRNRAVNAFVDDLAEAGSTRTIVLLFDAYEQCPPEVNEWLTRLLRRTRVDDESRIDRLLVVLAGQRVPVTSLCNMLGEQVVTSIHELSLWDHEHVKAFFDVNHVNGYGDEDVDFIVAKLRKGWSLGQAVSAVKQFVLEAKGP
jgi:hypothetical protein